MNYAEARPQIDDGDLIAVRGKHGLFGALTRFFTRSPYTHVGVALWLDGGLWMAELNGGRNHLVPVSQLADQDLDVFYPPVRRKDSIRDAVQDMLRTQISYGIPAVFMIGLLNVLRIKIFVHWRRILVCSGYCVAIYEQAGWPEHSRIISPQELTELLKPKLQIRISPNQPASAGFFI